MLAGNSDVRNRKHRSGLMRRPLLLAAGALIVASALGVFAVAQDAAEGRPKVPNGGRPPAPETTPPGKSCLDCHADLIAGKTAHEPAKKDCAECHLQRGRRHEFRNAYPQQTLCTRCHELKLEKNLHGPLAVNLCTGCHDPHGSDHPALTKAPESELCSTCHEELKGPRKKYVHGPFAVGICQVCHSAHSSENKKLLRSPGGELCLGCHEDIAPSDSGGDSVHEPARDGCTLCHSGHETDQKFMLKYDQPELCVKCHLGIGEKIEESKVGHQPVTAEGGCGKCHEPHNSSFANLLRKESADLCLSCHDREYPQPTGRPFPNMAAMFESLPYRHGPVREKNCEGCHEPHGSGNFRLLKYAYPEKFYAPYEEKNFALCFSCHPKELVLEGRQRITNFRDGDQNLHFLHVNRKKGRTCRACHETHASNLPHHIRETTPFGTWDMPIGFEKTETGGSCSPGCHKATGYDRGR